MSTKKCSKCKMEIDSKATKCPYCGSSQGMSCSGMLGALVFIVVIIGIFGVIGSSRDSSSKPNTSSSSSQSEEDNVKWANKGLRLYWASEESGKTDSLGLIHVSGAIGNASKKDYEYVAVFYSIYDESGAKIGDATDMTAGLKSGEIWKFEAIGSGKGAKAYRIDSVEAY